MDHSDYITHERCIVTRVRFDALQLLRWRENGGWKGGWCIGYGMAIDLHSGELVTLVDTFVEPDGARDGEGRLIK